MSILPIKNFWIYSLINFLFLLTFCAFASGQDIQNSNNTNIKIYVDYTFEFKNPDGSLNEMGRQLEEVKETLENANLKYEVLLLPWERVIREANQSDHALIFNITKTDQREGEYYWVPLLSENDGSVYLFSRNEAKFKNISKKEIFEGDYKSVCQTNTAQCTILKGFGLSESQILNIPQSASFKNQENLVLRGRADFLLGNMMGVKNHLVEIGEDPKSLTPLFKLTDGRTFLAAPKGINEALLAKINLAFGTDTSLPNIIVLGFDFPPYFYENEKGEIKGWLYPKLKNYLDRKKLNYKVEIVPWERAFKQAITRPNTLIMGLIRTPEREDEFHWLLPLNTQKYYLFAPNEDKYTSLTPEQIVSGAFSSVCENESTKCAFLKEIGFDDENIIKINSFSPKVQTNFVLNKRADFLIDNLNSLQDDLTKIGAPTDALVPIMEIGSIDNYLALQKNNSSELISLLLDLENLEKN